MSHWLHKFETETGVRAIDFYENPSMKYLVKRQRRGNSPFTQHRSKIRAQVEDIEQAMYDREDELEHKKTSAPEEYETAMKDFVAVVQKQCGGSRKLAAKPAPKAREGTAKAKAQAKSEANRKQRAIELEACYKSMRGDRDSEQTALSSAVRQPPLLGEAQKQPPHLPSKPPVLDLEASSTAIAEAPGSEGGKRRRVE